MKTNKKILSVLLSLVMLLCVMPLAVIPASAYRVGDTIQFGNYPQAEAGETTAIKNAANAATWKWYDYYTGNGNLDGSMVPTRFMQYADFFLNGSKYRAVKFNSYRPKDTSLSGSADNSYQDDNGYAKNLTYYFKFEPLNWRVVDPSSRLVICSTIIDAQPYQNVVRKKGDAYYIGTTGKYANDYASSSIRAWLNNDFYNTAFNNVQKYNINSQTINNDCCYTNKPEFNSAATTDKIYMLSYAEVRNLRAGINTFYPGKSSGTDYAKCQGLSEFSNGYSDWWLRSPGFDSHIACFMNYNGDYADRGMYVEYVEGIRPVCTLSELKNDTALKDRFTVSIAANPSAGGTVSGGGGYDKGATAYLKAVENSGYVFGGWYEGNTLKSSSKNYNVTVNDDINLTAKFKKIVNITAQAYPAAGGTVTGAGTCVEGEAITLKAIANPGYRFVEWYYIRTLNGAPFNQQVCKTEEYTLYPTTDRSFYAKFEPIQNYCNITVNIEPANAGTVSGAGAVPSGDYTTLEATANPGYTFVAFYDESGNKLNGAPLGVLADADKTFTAKFASNADFVILPMSTGGLKNGDWYFDFDAFVTAIAPIMGVGVDEETARNYVTEAMKDKVVRYDPNTGTITFDDKDATVLTVVPQNMPEYQAFSAAIKQINDPGAGEPQPDPNMCHWCGKVHTGFFQGIVGFFHRILAAIFGAKY